MRIKTNIILLLVFVIFLSLQDDFAQISDDGEMLSMWSPPDGSFAVEVPVSLGKINEYGAEAYGGTKSGYTFQIVIIDLPEKKMNLRLRDKLAGLQFLVGGDDDKDFIEKYLKVGGLAAKEIVYINQNNKGLMIDGCGHIYVLALHTKNRQDLNSKISESFFSSFQLLTNKKH